ncbi:MAG: PilZ domain-containing protein [Candidatus Aminicenantes bacterium]|nr:PilZ domain-containing protein [Candidatus Aminicenantes bacterium]
MSNAKVEKRSSRRFKIPGAKVYFRIDRTSFLRSLIKKQYHEEMCHLVNFSRGGINFLTDTYMKKDEKVFLKIFLPDEKASINLKGRVIWQVFDVEKSFKYKVGIEFFEFNGRTTSDIEKKLEKIMALESKFCP